MNITERLELIKVLYDSAYSQIKENKYNGVNSLYITIDSDNKVKQSPLSTDTIFNTNTFTICCLNIYYESYGHKNSHIVFSIIDSCGIIINKIPGSFWTVEKLSFLAVKEGNVPIPKISLFLNKKPSEKVEFTLHDNPELQVLWDFFLEVNENCSTVDEANIYFKYFNQKKINNQHTQTLDEYKKEIVEQKSLISQYGVLLKKIVDITNRVIDDKN